jgi:hypothetical protein
MVFRPYGFARLAEALARQGEHRPSLAAVREGIKAQEETGARQWDAQLHRLEGIAFLGLNRVEEGQSALEEALRIARRHQAKAYELRAATTLAGYGANRSGALGTRSARARLRLVHRGFDTADLKEAKTLLTELARFSLRRSK